MQILYFICVNPRASAVNALPIPPEVVVTDRGDDDVTFSFPMRRLGLVRHLGWPLIAVGVAVLYWIVWIGVGNLRMLNRPPRVEDYVMLGIGLVLSLVVYFPIGLGLAILAGRRVVELRGGTLRTTERVGPLWRTKRWPLDKLSRVQIIAFTPGSQAAPPGSLWSRLDALTGLLADGTRFMIVPGYPRSLLNPVAAEIARRCNAKFDPAVDREPVAVETVVQRDVLDDWAADDDAGPPPGTRIVVDDSPDGLTINVPPLGFRGFPGVMVVIGVIIAVALTAVIATQDLRRTPTFVCSGVAAVGMLIATHGVRVARRRVVIAVVAGRVMVLQTALARSTRREWPADALAAVRVGKSGIEVNEEPVLEVQLVPKDGAKLGLMTGRDVAELRWLAAVIRRRLGS